MADVDAMPGVTVVVPTINRGSYLVDTVRDLLAQTHRPLEILLVDQSDTVSPDLEAEVTAHPHVISYHRVDFKGLPIARNYGWQRARHEVVVYVDDDIRCGPELVGEHWRTLSEPGIGLSAGGIDEARVDEAAPARIGVYDSWLAVAHRDFSANGVRDVAHVPGGNFGVRREVIVAVGGVDERLGIGSALLEETDLALRVAEVGYRSRFNGAARLIHLAAGAGGTRQTDWRRYVFALAHNRSIMIRRHSAWYQWPVGLAWSGKLMAAYTLHYRDPRILIAGLRGMVAGWRAGGKPPLCTRFDPAGS